jgi:hypothetical protein
MRNSWSKVAYGSDLSMVPGCGVVSETRKDPRASGSNAGLEG